MNIQELKLETLEPKQANKEILVRFYPDSSDRNNSRLMSINSLRAQIGDAFTAKFVDKFWQSGKQRESFRLRRGIEIVFINR